MSETSELLDEDSDFKDYHPGFSPNDASIDRMIILTFGSMYHLCPCYFNSNLAMGLLLSLSLCNSGINNFHN